MFTIAALAAGLCTTSVAAGQPTKDPFIGGVWHAISPSWPGSLKFDAKAKKVVLSPYGGKEIQAQYSYTVEPQKPGQPLSGKLLMTTSEGQRSESAFSISNGKSLSLTFQAGQMPEMYQLLTPQEEKAEGERLKKLFEQTGSFRSAQ